MADNVLLQAPTSTGEIIATDQIGTSSGPHYQYVKLIDATAGSSAAIPGGSSGLAVTSTAIVITSGTITSTAATSPWSSAPSFNMPILSASSGLVQTLSSGPVLLSSAGVSQLILPISSTAGYAQVTSSAGLMVTISSGVITSTATTITSGTVTLSSAIGVSSGTVTATAATNPWSSAPGFNVPIVNASSGLLQVIPVTSSGINLYTTQGLYVQSASSGLFLSSGLITFSSVPTVTATAGTNPWSSAPGFNVPIVSVSSGLVQLSSQISVTATAGTNPWSSAPGFNVPMLSASSGLIIALGRVTVTTSGLSSYHKMSTGAAVVDNMTTAASNLVSYVIFNSSATPQAVKIYNSTTTGTTVGTTAGLILLLLAPGSTGGGGANFSFPSPGLYSSDGWSVAIVANMGDTDTGAPGTNAVSFHAAYQV